MAAEIENCIKRKSLASEIVSKLNNDTLPLRVIHNDTKLNNILFDRRTNTPLCVVDLDTVMPGAVCYDFGDSVRSAASVTGDGQDLSIVHLDMDLFEACAAGYINSAKEFLTDAEAESFIIAPMVITYENALRFLTDYLDGDIYFRIRHPLQNLLRCRAHLKLVDDMEKKLPEMERIIKKHMNNK